MTSVKAIFIKQAKDMTKNFSVLIMFIIFPLVAFGMTELVARGGMAGMSEYISDTMFVTMMASIFVGMALIQCACGIIAEDRETKSLRCLVIAGVKPHSYLLGIGGVVFTASLLTAIVFGLIARFERSDFLAFMLIMASGTIASILLGATVGIFSKNQQAAAGLSMPLAMILGFGPMVAQFNYNVGRVFSIFYTQQINVLVNDFSAGITEPLIVIWANIAVFAVLFAIAYKKKGLRN
ncbi:MAG: ABC transporter permease [Oscillospiraceae bacterium]|nr:ABC transporter permease [Oscillospiraceae bacterium]